MPDYSCSIVCDAVARGPASTLLIIEINSLTTDMADILHDCKIHQVSAASIVISSVNASLNGYVWMCKTALIDFQTLVAQWMVSLEHVKRTVIRT